jgi:hypothetical protein
MLTSDEAARRRRIRRTTIALFALVVAFYAAFVLLKLRAAA